MAKKTGNQEGGEKKKEIRLPLRFKDFDKPILDALEEFARDNRQSANAAGISLLEEGLRRRGYLPEKPERQG